MEQTSHNRPANGLLSGLFLAVMSGLAFAEVSGIATIDGETVSYEEYEQMVYAEARKTFYQAAPPEETYLSFRREGADKIVNRKLKLKEARRRGLEPDREYVGLELAKREAQ